MFVHKFTQSSSLCALLKEWFEDARENWPIHKARQLLQTNSFKIRTYILNTTVKKCVLPLHFNCRLIKDKRGTNLNWIKECWTTVLVKYLLNIVSFWIVLQLTMSLCIMVLNGILVTRVWDGTYLVHSF